MAGHFYYYFLTQYQLSHHEEHHGPPFPLHLFLLPKAGVIGPVSFQLVSWMAPEAAVLDTQAPTSSPSGQRRTLEPSVDYITELSRAEWWRRNTSASKHVFQPFILGQLSPYYVLRTEALMANKTAQLHLHGALRGQRRDRY